MMRNWSFPQNDLLASLPRVILERPNNSEKTRCLVARIWHECGKKRASLNKRTNTGAGK